VQSLGVYIILSIKWKAQFKIMEEKIKEAIRKFKLINIYLSLVHVYFNVYLMKKVYFRCGIVLITELQENKLKKLYKLTILKKLRLSEKFL